MKKIAIILSLLFLTNSAFAGIMPNDGKNIDSKIEERKNFVTQVSKLTKMESMQNLKNY